MARYRATRDLSVRFPSSRRDHIGVDGEVLSSVFDSESVPAGADLTVDQVIALGRQFADEDGEPLEVTDANGDVVDADNDDLAEAIADGSVAFRTLLDVWLADGSIVREED